MVRVEENESSSSSNDGSSVPSSRAPTPAVAAAAGAAPPAPPQQQQQQQQQKAKPPPASASASSAEAILAQCLKLLRGQSDEHKFAGLVMVTKHVPALTGPSSSANGGGGSGGQLRQICSAVGPAFLHRLLRTPGDKSSSGGGGSSSSGGGGGVDGLSVYQEIALGVLAAFFRDESLVPKFLPIAPALVRAIRAADAGAQTQGLCDGLYCAQALAGVPGGIERLLRAGAAPAVVSRLSAATGDRILARRTAVAAAAAAAAAAEKEKKEEEETSDGNGSGNSGGGGGGGSGGVEESKRGGGGGGGEETKTGEGGEEAKQAAAAAAAAATNTAACSRSTPEGFGGGKNAKAAAVGGGDGDDNDNDNDDGPAAKRAEALAFAFVGRALEASGGNCLGQRELTAVAEAFRDDPTSAKFSFMDLLLRWASLQEGEASFNAAAAAAGGQEGERSEEAWARRGPFPAALREGLLQALHGAAEDERRDSALALLASLLRALGQEWAVEEEEEGEGEVNEDARRDAKAKQKMSSKARKRKRGTFVAFAVRCAAGEVRILLDEALSLFVPAAARGGAGAVNGDGDDEAAPGTGQKARGAMGPAGVDPSIGIAAEIAGANAAAAASAAGAGAASPSNGGEKGEGGEGPAPPLARAPLSDAQLKGIKEKRAARLLRMVPVSLGVAESTIAFLCGGGDGVEENEEEQAAGRGEGEREKAHGRWEELPINTLQDLQKTLVGLFGCVLDYFSEIRRWVVAPGTAVPSSSTGKDRAEDGAEESSSAAATPSIVDRWAMQRLGLACSRTLGVWVAEDPESLPQRFLENLPVLLALDVGVEAPDSDDEESDDDEDEDSDEASAGMMMMVPTLAAFPGAARYVGGGGGGGNGGILEGDQAAAAAAVALATRPDESLHNILRAMLALSYEATPLAAMVEEGVTARLARLAAAGAPAIAALLSIDNSEAAAAAIFPSSSSSSSSSASSSSSSLPLPLPLSAPPEQVSEAVRSPLITACGLLTNILTSAGHLAWPERVTAGGSGGERRRRQGKGQQTTTRPPSHPVLGHPGMGECMASLAEVASAAGCARRAGGGARWRLVVAHATLVVMTVARAAAAPGNSGLAPASGLVNRKTRWSSSPSSSSSSSSSSSLSVWKGMARAVDEALGSLSAAPGRGLIGIGGGGGGGGGRGEEENEEASYEEGAIWQWCLECAREMEAASGGMVGNPYVSSGVIPRRVLKSLIEASSDGRI